MRLPVKNHSGQTRTSIDQGIDLLKLSFCVFGSHAHTLHFFGCTWSGWLRQPAMIRRGRARIAGERQPVFSALPRLRTDAAAGIIIGVVHVVVAQGRVLWIL